MNKSFKKNTIQTSLCLCERECAATARITNAHFQHLASLMFPTWLQPKKKKKTFLSFSNWKIFFFVIFKFSSLDYAFNVENIYYFG